MTHVWLICSGSLYGTVKPCASSHTHMIFAEYADTLTSVYFKYLNDALKLLQGIIHILFFFKCQIWNYIFVWMTITVIICKCCCCCVGLIWENVVVPSCQCAVFTVFSWQLHTFEEITGLNKWWAARTHVQTMFALISHRGNLFLVLKETTLTYSKWSSCT